MGGVDERLLRGRLECCEVRIKDGTHRVPRSYIDHVAHTHAVHRTTQVELSLSLSLSLTHLGPANDTIRRRQCPILIGELSA